MELVPRHSFYDWCNEILTEAEFDEVVEMFFQPYYSDCVNLLSVSPGWYHRMLFVAQYEGLESEREYCVAVRGSPVAAPAPAPE